MPKMVAVAFVLIVAMASPTFSQAQRTLVIEFLQNGMSPKDAKYLSGLSCRNTDRIVHIDISVDWPSDGLVNNKDGLVFSTDENEYLFPTGTYRWEHGVYLIKGYFIVRNGGMHQGIVSLAFEKVDDSKVLLNPNVQEVKKLSAACK
jgi:hypothetical protein